MKLTDFIKLKGCTLAEAARDLSVSHQAVRFWARGDCVPRPAQMKKISKWSDGLVKPVDFYDV